MTPNFNFQAERFQYLLKANDENEPWWKCSPLHAAIFHKKIDVIKTILECNTSCLSSKKYKWCALHPLLAACMEENLEIVNMLINAG